MITVSGLSHQIGGASILKDIDTAIPKGGVTALIGPNGAGKSTLFSLLSRKDPLQTGTVTLDGVDMAAMDHADLALRMAVVAQDVGVASRLRIKDLIGFGRWPHAKGSPTPDDVAWIDRALHQFDLTALADRFLDEVSGGQRQRAFVAMAYAQDTDWLLLDEPLNNLDLRYAHELMSALQGLTRTAGKSVVIILHDLNYAMTWADSVIAMKDGQIVFAGGADEVMTSEALSALYDTNIAVVREGGKTFVWHHG